MGWRRDQVWLDDDVLWFRERAGDAGVVALALPALPRFGPAETGLDASRRRRLAAQSERRRKLATRTVPAVALVVGSATMLPINLARQGGSASAIPLPEDPPSLTVRLSHIPDLTRPAVATTGRRTDEPEVPTIAWRQADAVGLPFAGRLVDGTRLPTEGPDWLTWNPNADEVPNRPWRLFGHERTIRAIVSVATAHRAAYPDAPPLLVGDVSRRHGGPMDQHRSHQNGLDVDVYYPRRDGKALPPASAAQVDRELAQDILDRFVAAGAEIVFVGYATGLRGPGEVVEPYPNHEDHMHVRFRAPA